LSIKKVYDIKYGDILEENIFREDGLLVLPKGISIKEKEYEYLIKLKIEKIEVSAFSYSREYKDSETFQIIKDTFMNSGFWDKKTATKISNELKTKFKKYKKILDLFTMIRQVDHYTFTSSINISIIIGHLMYENKINKVFIDFVFLALIHDIGKIKVSKITTQKKDLNEDEFREIRNHPNHSFEILQQMGFSQNTVLFVTQTHEKWDGTGYPYGMERKNIQVFAQLIAIVEMYNAMLSPRPHREQFHLIEVLDKIKREAGLSFGKEYIELFESEFRPYKEGEFVELNNGMTARIDKINNMTPLFPIVTLFSEDTGEEINEINLNRNKELRIMKKINDFE
jgi:HD-GYP domain-containing protein (c-di-GMP phosphodiesterase class II)